MPLREVDAIARLTRLRAFERECADSDSNAIVGDTPGVIRILPVLVHTSGKFAVFSNGDYYWAESVTGFQRFEKKPGPSIGEPEPQPEPRKARSYDELREQVRQSAVNAMVERDRAQRAKSENPALTEDQKQFNEAMRKDRNKGR